MPVAALPERLRAETRDLHVAAERSGLMAALLQGSLPRHRYRALLRNLHAIYGALETALDAHREHPQAGLLRMPVLFRAPVLAADLRALAEPADGAEAPIEPAAVAYVDRLLQAGPTGLVAHAYVRYLGDLHGGQMIRRVVERAYGLPAEHTRFYDFGSASEVAELRARFRAALTAVPVTPAEADAVVAEVRWAFAQHQRLFAELLP